MGRKVYHGQMREKQRNAIAKRRVTILKIVGGLALISPLLFFSGSQSSAQVSGSTAARFTPNYNFPRLFSYSRFGNASGLPYVTNGIDGQSRNGTVNMSAINDTARNQVVTLMTEPATANYLVKGSDSVIAKLRAANPGAILMAYWWTDFPWTTADQNLDPHVVGEAVRYAKSHNYYLVNQAGGEWGGAFGPINLDFANPEFVTWYTDYIAIRIYDTGLWDGIFFDNFCDTISWMDGGQTGTNKMSLTQHGHTYASWTEFDADHAVGMTNFIRGLRQRVGTQYILAGNCGLGGQYDSINGSMSESFPQFGNGFTKWWWNMFSPTGGYVVHDTLVQPPTFNFLTHYIPTCSRTDSSGSCIAWDEILATNADARKSVRYTLTSALLGNGYYFPDEDRSPNAGWAANTWWYDEFDNAGQGVGYLGQPTSIPYQIIDPAKLGATDYIQNGGFETGNSGSWYTNAVGSGNGWKVETGGAHAGSYALHATITNDTTPSYAEVAQQTISGLPGGGTYSATFWARADRQRRIQVMIDNDRSPYANQILELDTTWRRYQVSAQIIASDKLHLNFYLGGEAGDVWFDDVTFMQGTGQVWARDFDHGTSFVNPGTGAITIPLLDEQGQAKSMRHILGTQDPSVNNGQAATSLTIPAADGIVMLSTTNPPNNPSQCTEQWSCSDWSACSNDQQTRTCTDSNACRTTAQRPALTQTCAVTPPADTTPPAAVTDLRAQ